MKETYFVKRGKFGIEPFRNLLKEALACSWRQPVASCSRTTLLVTLNYAKTAV